MIYNEEHIFQLILEKLSGEISEENLQFLNKAAAEDPSVKRCLDEMEDALESAGPDFMNDVYNEMAWGKVLSLLDVEATPPAGPVEEPVKIAEPVSVPEQQPIADVRRKSPSYIWLAAASVLILISVSLFFFLPEKKAPAQLLMAGNDLAKLKGIHLLLDNGDTIALPDNNPEYITAADAKLHSLPGQLTFTATGSSTGWNTLLVPIGKEYRVTLADGSQVHMNAFSSLRFPFNFSGHTREVYLDGEAYFSIAPDPQHPFIVHSGQVATKVLGTSFNINAYTDSLVVTSLVQGSVSTSEGDQAAVLLKPGMETVYSTGHSQIVRAFDEDVTLAWRKGEFTYYNKSLAALGDVIQHWYGKSLVFEDTSLYHKMLTGVIERDHSVAEFLENVKKTSGIDYRITDDKIYLSIE